MKIVIDQEIKSMLPPLSSEELAALSMKLQSEGCREALVVWKETGILLEGHHRYAICQEHKIKAEYLTMKFPSRELAIEWVIDNQLGRRNLTDQWRAYFIGKEYLNKKQMAVGVPVGKNCPPGARASESIAEKHGVSEKTVRNDAAFAKAVDKAVEAKPPEKAGEAKAELLNGEHAKKDIVKASRPIPTTPKRQPKKPKPGKIVFDFKKIEEPMGKLTRALDECGNAYRKDERYRHLDSLLAKFAETWTEWKKDLTKSKD